MSSPLWLRRGIARVEAATSGYLPQLGWVESRAAKVARDPCGRPIPWFTYPAICFLEGRVKSDWRVLEFGAGMGTLWWKSRVAEVLAIEHDAAWATKISEQCDARVIRVSGETADSYIKPALAATNDCYEVVIVDGLYRTECLLSAPKILKKSGVILLDDAQRSEYRDGVRALVDLGFRLIELHGPQPVSKHPGCTAILYRSDNVLGL